MSKIDDYLLDEIKNPDLRKAHEYLSQAKMRNAQLLQEKLQLRALAKRLLDGLQAANPQPADLSLITEAREVLK